MSKMTSIEFGQAIRKARKSFGLRQRDVAMASGTGIRFIVDLENGKETCQLGKALHICRMLGIAIDLNLPNPTLFKEMDN